MTKKGVNFLSGNYNTMLSALNRICGVNISSAETREKRNTNCEHWKLTKNQQGLSLAKVKCKMLNINFNCMMKTAKFSYTELLRKFSQKVLQRLSGVRWARS